MLLRHIINYLPSLFVPALAAFVAIFCYTRLLSPEEYGAYSLALSIMTMLNAVFFYWLQTSLPRMVAKAQKEGMTGRLHATAYLSYACSGLLLIFIIFAIKLLLPNLSIAPLLWLAAMLALLRSLLNINQAFHRAELRFRRYNFIECAQALLGIATGLVIVLCWKPDAQSALLGLLLGMLCMAMFDVDILKSATRHRFSQPLFKDIARLGLPLVASYGLAFILSASDRFLIEHYRGLKEVGIYAAGYSLMDRIGQILFMAVALPSFPLTIRKLEHEGMEAARAQTYANGIAMLALGLPASIGLIFAAPALGNLLIGEAFREGAVRVMPFVAISMLLNGLATHYFDHAFHLGKKTYLLLLTQTPAALLNIALNILLIPGYGYMGAAYSTVIAYALLLSLSIIIGRRAFPIHFPFLPALQIMAATAFMALALTLFPFSPDTIGLLTTILLGGIIYGASILAFNVAGARTTILSLRRRL